jgi:hypothetical protein
MENDIEKRKRMYATSLENSQTKKTHRTHHIPKTAKEFLPLIFI